MSKPVTRWLISGAVFLHLMIGPFVDHIVGMRQFEKLCEGQTGVKVYPDAINSKSAKHVMGAATKLSNYAIQIEKYQIKYLDFDTNIVIAEYNYFSTPGGRIGGLVMLGRRYGCSPEDSSNRNFLDLSNFKKQRIIK